MALQILDSYWLLPYILPPFISLLLSIYFQFYKCLIYSSGCQTVLNNTLKYNLQNQNKLLNVNFWSNEIIFAWKFSMGE